MKTYKFIYCKFAKGKRMTKEIKAANLADAYNEFWSKGKKILQIIDVYEDGTGISLADNLDVQDGIGQDRQANKRAKEMLTKLLKSDNPLVRHQATEIMIDKTTSVQKELYRNHGSFMTAVLQGDKEIALMRADQANRIALLS